MLCCHVDEGQAESTLYVVGNSGRLTRRLAVSGGGGHLALSNPIRLTLVLHSHKEPLATSLALCGRIYSSHCLNVIVAVADVGAC